MTDTVKTTASPLDMPLPCDIQCGSVHFKKGVALRVLVAAAARCKTTADLHPREDLGTAVADFHAQVTDLCKEMRDAE